MKKGLTGFYQFCWVLFVGAGLAPLAASSAPAAESAGQDDGLAIEEIIVTAEKRDLNLQKIPSSVTVFTGDALDRQNVLNTVDLSSLAPGLTIAKSEGFRRIIVIRGLGLEANQNDIANPSVAFHIDGVYIPSDISTNADFLDIERIEVLRGPQGTVFGQNAVGGVINVITKQPSLDDFEGRADLAVGSYDQIRARGAINVPISSQVAVRASYSYYKHKGFTKNLALPGVRLDEDDNFTGRIQMLWQAADNFSATLRAQFFTTDVNDRAQKNILDPTPDPRELRQDYNGRFMYQSQIYSGELKWELSWATVKSISSYQYEEENQRRDGDRSDGFFQPADIVPDRGRTIETVTQEINIVSAGEQPLPLDWILGVFYLKTDTNVRFLEFGDFNGDGVIDTTENKANPFSNPDLGFQTNSRPSRESWSIFAQGTFHVTDTLRVTGGLRYTDDSVNSQVRNFYAVDPLLLQTSTTKLTGKASIEWDVTPDNMAYISFTRGFKPGGSNLTFGSFVPAIYKDETVSAYEGGLKNRFFDNSVQFNLAAFYYDYNNFQFQNTDPLPFSGGVDNIANTEVYGLEGELAAVIQENIRLDANFSYLKTNIQSNTLALDSVAGNAAQNALLAQGFGLFSPEVIAARAAAIQSIQGNNLPKSPSFTTNINLTYQVNVADRGTLTAHVQYVYRNSFIFRVFNNSATDLVPSYDLWNIDFRWEPDGKSWSLDFIIINLADSNAVNSRFTDSFGVGSTSDELVPPQQFLIRAGISF